MKFISRGLPGRCEILLSVGKKYDIRGKSANAQLGKAQFFGDLLYFHGVSL